MLHASIADVISTMEDLLTVLEDAYWETSTVEGKDMFYDIISAINHELSELAKLSIQDHNLEYEPVTVEFQIARRKLVNIGKQLDTCLLRSSTVAKLEPLLKEITHFSTHQTGRFVS